MNTIISIGLKIWYVRIFLHKW